MHNVWKSRASLPQHSDKVEILLHSPGGHADIAYRVMKFFRRRFTTVNVIVPLVAKSAATLICLGADAIFMGELAELGPLDVQINDPVDKGEAPTSPVNDFKSMEYLREYAVDILDYFIMEIVERSGMSIREAIHESIPAAVGIIRPLYEKIDPLDLGDHKRALAVGEEYAKRLLKQVRNPKSEQIVDQLVWKYPSHDFAVDFEECRALGLPVDLLEPDDDAALVNVIMEFSRHGLPFDGFITEQGAVGQPTRTKRSEKSRKRKVPAVRTNGHVGIEQ